MSADVTWWQQGLIYQIYPLSFCDTDGDGFGDLEGVRRHLDYLSWLGVNAIWLSPVYASPMKDFGYDVSDHKAIHPLFGSMAIFDRLVADAHSHGIKVIMDFVLNHTSDLHPWFVDSRSSRDDPKRDWYIWRDAGPEGGLPNNWLSHFGGPAWEWDEATGQYYYHAFLCEQPDLNWRNPEVRGAMLDILRFWLDRGVDGFRVDVLYEIIKDDRFRDDPPNRDWEPSTGPHDSLTHVFSSDRPEVHDIVLEMRKVLDPSGAVMIAEIWLPVEQLVTYYGAAADGTDLPLNFQLIQLPWNADRIREAIRTYEDLLPSGGWPNWVLGNHDVSRIVSRVGPAQARVAAVMLLMLRGTPTMYYGDEIGMMDVPIPPDRVHDQFERNVPGLGLGRDPSRTPMQWDDGPHAGFTVAEPWLPVAEDHHTINVQRERGDAGSMLSLYRALIDLRREHPALSVGSYAEFPAGGSVLAWLREGAGERFLVAVNLDHEPQTLALDSVRCLVVLSTHGTRPATRPGGQLRLSGNEAVVARVVG